jgi:hypothetical protein
MRELAKLHTGLGGGNVAVVDTVDGNEHYKQSFWGIGAGIEALRSGKAFHVLSFDGTFSKQAVEFFKKVLCSCTFADLLICRATTWYYVISIMDGHNLRLPVSCHSYVDDW